MFCINHEVDYTWPYQAIIWWDKLYMFHSPSVSFNTLYWDMYVGVGIYICIYAAACNHMTVVSYWETAHANNCLLECSSIVTTCLMNSVIIAYYYFVTMINICFLYYASRGPWLVINYLVSCIYIYLHSYCLLCDKPIRS